MADNLSALLSDAFTIYSEAYLKIGRIGLKVSELQGSPLQPKLWKELVYATRLYRVISPSIVLNSGGTAITGVIGDIDTINNLLLKLKRSVKLYSAIGFPTPLTGYIFVVSDSGSDVDATYITATLEGGLPNSRRILNGNGISLTDGGPQGNMVIVNTAAIDTVAVSLNSSPVNLNFNSLVERWFYGNTNVIAAVTFTKSGDGNARRMKLNFTISGLTPGGSTHDLTFWANTKSSDARWNPGGVNPLKWRPIEDGEYTAEAWTFDGVNWIISFSDIIS
jgi:hypothetical protein